MAVTKVQTEKHYVSGSGHYLGMFVGFQIKDGSTVLESHMPTPDDETAVEVPSAPPDGTYLWNGETWQAP